MSHVVVINPFEVPQGCESEALAMWDDFAAYFRKQPGYVSTKLHRALSPDSKFHLVNIAIWESADAFSRAVSNPNLAEIASRHTRDFPHYPGIYEIIRT